MERLPTLLYYTFPGGWGWVVGLAENKANSAQLELGLGLSLAINIDCLIAFMMTTLTQYNTWPYSPN